MDRKNILLKLTGEIFSVHNSSISAATARSIANQIKMLQKEYHFNIVIGGGNFFRGSKQGADLTLRPAIAHHVGMVATMLNGLMLQEILYQAEIPSQLFSAIECPAIAAPIALQQIADAMAQQKICIFVGGTGNPYFTTDSTAIIRALQTDAHEVWKATTVDGIYDSDPKRHPHATIIKTMSHDEFLSRRLAIMDVTAMLLAQEHNIVMRVFNIFSDNALINAATMPSFGSSICTIDKEQYGSDQINRYQSKRV